VADHEGHLGGCDVMSSDNEIGFVLAGWVIEDYEELAIAWAHTLASSTG
jgi:hypothetical protein